MSTATFYRLLGERMAVERIDTSDATALERKRGGVVAELRYAGLLLKRLRALRAEVRQTRPDLLYLVASSSAVGRARDAAFLAAARPYVGHVVAHVHVGDFHASLASRLLAPATRFVLARVDRFLFLSERLAERSRPYLRAEQVGIVPNTIQPEMEVAPDELAEKWADRPGASTLRVVYVSNMVPSKGYEALALGVAAYNATNPARPAEVDFVGAWPSEGARRAFDELIGRVGLAEWARVHGAVADRSWIRDLLLEADVLALPTTYAHEAQPLCIIEAFAAGTPVIATAHASIPDYVNASNGVILEGPDGGEIGVALATLADAPTWVQRARGARDTFDALFSADAVQSKLLDALGLTKRSAEASQRA